MCEKTKQAGLRRLGGALALSSFLALAGCSTELYSNLSERDANQMIQVLTSEGIEANRTTSADGKFAIEVASSQFSSALSALSAHGLPRKDFGSLGEVFNADKLVSTPFEERARFMHALNEELAASLTEIDGVVSARVHVNMPREEALDPTNSIPRASVFIYQGAGTDLSADVPTIKNLIVNSVPNLRYDAVTVALFTSSTETTSSTRGNGLAMRPIFGFNGVLPMIGLAILAFFGLRFATTRRRAPAGPAMRQTPVRESN